MLKDRNMIGREKGFTIIELLVVMTVFAIVIALAGSTFSLLLGQSKQQARTSESQIEGIIGLELLRTDIEHAGFGLLWSFPTNDLSGNPVTVSYTEAGAGVKYSASITDIPFNYNDATNNVPRAILSGSLKGLNKSDVLVIKSTVAGLSSTSQNWTYISKDSSGAVSVKPWGSDDLVNGDKVIVMRPITPDFQMKQLIMAAPDDFYTTFSTSGLATGFFPTEVSEMFIIYGLSTSATTPVRPFNRADYFISDVRVPTSCAPKTGVLAKAILNHDASGTLSTALPLLDCVADMHIVFRRAIDGNLNNMEDRDNLLGLNLNAQQIREQIKEVRVSILTHEGQRDRNYKYPNDTVDVGGRSFDLKKNIGANYQNFRWKVHTLVVKPKNLM